MNGISVIVPTYDNVDFIIDAIKSIKESFEQNKFTDYEILIGIDNCKKTLLMINENNFFNEYNCFYFLQNNGPYIIKNTLAKYTKYDHLIFFDSDDLMRKIFIEEVIKFHPRHKCIRFGFKNFSTQLELQKAVSSIQVADGVMYIEKNLFISINGYYPWKCAADTEINNRLNKRGIQTYRSSLHCFDRRMHQNNLTRKIDTNFQSPIRKEYSRLIQELRGKGCPNPEILNIAENKKIIF